MVSDSNELLQIHNLTVAAFETDQLTPELSRWREENRIPMAESCARQVWYGRHIDFESFPENSIDLMRGAPAYAFMLRMYSDIDNNKEWAQNSPLDFNQLRETYLENNPAMRPILEKFNRFFMSDSRLIRDQILSELLPREFRDVIRAVSGQKTGEKALLIGSLGRHGTISDTTREAVLALRKSRKNNVDEIFVMHPELPAAREIEKQIRGFHPAILTKSTHLETIGFEELALCFEYCDRILVDLPMEMKPAADKDIMHKWSQRARNDNTLTHVRGAPQLRGHSSPLWQTFAQAHMGDVFLPEDLDAHEQIMRAHNLSIVGRAKTAFSIAAQLRDSGQRPNAKLLETTPVNLVVPDGPQCG